VASKLRGAGFDTVLLDLLEPHEALAYQNAFDVELQTVAEHALGWFSRHLARLLATKNLVAQPAPKRARVSLAITIGPVRRVTPSE